MNLIKDHSNVDQFAKKKKKKLKQLRRINGGKLVYFHWDSSSILTFMVFDISLTLLG